MKWWQLYIWMVFAGSVATCNAAESGSIALALDASLVASQASIVRLCAVIPPAPSPVLQALTDRIVKDLEGSGLCAVHIVHAPEPKTHDDMRAHATSGYPFAVYMALDGDDALVTRLYDTETCVPLLTRKWSKRPTHEQWGDAAADELWGAIFGSSSMYQSYIAYVKRTKDTVGMPVYRLCWARWDGSCERVLVTRRSPLVAPIFCHQLRHDEPWLFFSESGPINVRLCATDSCGRIARVVSRAGTTVGVCAGVHRDRALYCHSGSIWEYAYRTELHAGSHARVISAQPGQPCSHPCHLENGDIIYGCGGKIMRWSAATKSPNPLVGKGAVAPCVHEAAGVMVFGQRVGGVMQVMAFDLTTGAIRQVTSGPGNKIDPVISPCGSCVAYTKEQGARSEIWATALSVDRSWRISPEGETCSYAAWSPHCRT